MANLKIILCDTNQEELEGYAKICRAVCETKKVQAAVTTFSSSQALLFELGDQAYCSMVDVLIVEPDGGCEAVAATARKLGFEGLILYLSRSLDKRYFYQAFGAKAWNFVEKGDLKRFKNVFEELLEAAKQIERQYIAVSYNGEYRQIDVRDVYYFETAEDHLVRVWYAGGQFVFPSSLTELEERLKGRGFFRIHRSYYVSIDAIHKVSYEEAVLNNGQSVPVSRSNYPALKAAIASFNRH